MNKYKQGYEQGKFDAEMSILQLPHQLYFGQTFTQQGNTCYQFLVTETYEEAVSKFEEIFKEDRLDLLNITGINNLDDWHIICMRKDNKND